jgi:NTE family protein
MSPIKRRPRIGLALSGGGARGLAHIGVLKVLHNAGIPIDYVSGASMGGIIAGLYCAGIPVDELESIALDLTRPNRFIKLIDFSPPRRGLLNGDIVINLLQEIITGDRQIEHLPIPLALAAVDLKRNQDVCINTGSLLEAMMATAAIPGLFDPVIKDDQILVDGGVLNNLPVELTRKMGAEIVIAVDVNYYYDVELPWEEKPVVAHLTTLLPSLFLDIYQAEMIMISALTESRLKESKPDFLLRPNIPYNVNIFLGFPYADQIIATGEKVTHSFLSQIRAKIKPRLHWPTALDPK